MKYLNKLFFIILFIIIMIVVFCPYSMAEEQFSRAVIFDVSKFIMNEDAESYSNKQDVVGFTVRRSGGIFKEVFEDKYMFLTLAEQLNCKSVRIDIIPDPRKRYDRVVVYCK